MDDGSTDGSTDELAKVKDPRLKLVKQSNAGVGKARNTGISNSNGTWISFLDADDAWMPCHLEELNRIALSHPNAGLISTACIEATGTDIPTITNDKNKTTLIHIVDYFNEASRKIGFINSSSAAIRSDIAASIGGFSSRKTGEDLEYWIKVALKHEVAVSSRITCVYFRDTGGVMQKVSTGQKLQTSAAIIRTLRDFSTPVAVLCNEADVNPELWQRSSIRQYVNGAIMLAIKGALYRGHILNAKNLSRMFLHPLTLKQKTVQVLLLAPTPILRAAAISVTNLKRL